MLAAGGIADGCGIAAALMLGADGVLIGTRYWATQEALIHPAAKARVLAPTGDETVRTSVYDIVRGRPWPAGYNGRLMRNDFIETWRGREDELRRLARDEFRAVEAADRRCDYDLSNVTVGKAIGLIDDLPGAGDLTERLATEAQAQLSSVNPQRRLRTLIVERITMPLLRFDLVEGRSPGAVQALLDAAHDAMWEAFQVPATDRCQVVQEHPAGYLVVEDTGLGIPRTENRVVLQVTSRPRSREMKREFYRLLCRNLEERCGIAPSDVVVSMVTNGDEDWSFGHGRAQFLTGEL